MFVPLCAVRPFLLRAAVLVVLCGDRTSAEPWGETTALSLIHI